MATRTGHSELDPDFLLQAYAHGWFPMGEAGTRRVQWFSPDPRGILPLQTFHVPARLARTLRQGHFELRVDTAFEAVMRRCAERSETWISEDIIDVYTELHRRGFAHSVEAWQAGELAGGLYGVSLRGAFFGESMFHIVPDASKVALSALVARLRDRGYRLLDVQWVTPHLEQFGAVSVARRQYLALLAQAMLIGCEFVDVM